MSPRASIFWKLFWGNVAVITAILIAGGVFVFGEIDNHYQQKLLSQQQRQAHLACEYVAAIWPDLAKIDAFCKRQFAGTDSRLTVIAADGAVLGDSQSSPSAMSNHKTNDRPEIIDAIGGKTGLATRHSDTIGIEFRYLALPLEIGGKTLAAVRVAIPATTIERESSFAKKILLISFAAMITLAILLGMLINWILYAPLKKLTALAEKISTGDLNVKFQLSGNDEFAILVKALAAMRDSLVGQIQKAEAEHHNLHSVLANLSEGIIAVQADGKIAFLNNAVTALLGSDKIAVGEKVQHVMHTIEIVDLYNRLVAEKRPQDSQAEINRQGRNLILQVRGAWIEKTQSDIRAVIVIRDITTLASAAAMKSQFVANASHELRTPIATIRAAVDSLAEIEPDDLPTVRKCSDILDRQVKRLESMTKDLLDLHMVEADKIKLDIKEIRTGDLADWLASTFNQSAAMKHISLKIVANPATSVFKSDRKLIELILRNIVDNAIKFTPADGTVECSLQSSDAEITMSVRDTGCGIKPSDQSRVFERFYQSDSSRSGDHKYRGTGLGLAIVKHAAEQIGARVALESQLDVGTTIKVIVPITDTDK